MFSWYLQQVQGSHDSCVPRQGNLDKPCNSLWLFSASKHMWSKAWPKKPMAQKYPSALQKETCTSQAWRCAVGACTCGWSAGVRSRKVLSSPSRRSAWKFRKPPQRVSWCFILHFLQKGKTSKHVLYCLCMAEESIGFYFLVPCFFITHCHCFHFLDGVFLKTWFAALELRDPPKKHLEDPDGSLQHAAAVLPQRCRGVVSHRCFGWQFLCESSLERISWFLLVGYILYLLCSSL